MSKLAPSLRDKKIHNSLQIIQFYLSLGMNLSKIHRVIKFEKSNWLKVYIDFDTEKKNSKSSFERSFF